MKKVLLTVLIISLIISGAFIAFWDALVLRYAPKLILSTAIPEAFLQPDNKSAPSYDIP